MGRFILHTVTVCVCVCVTSSHVATSLHDDVQISRIRISEIPNTIHKYNTISEGLE